MDRRAFWVEKVEGDHDIDLHEAGTPHRSSWTGYRWGWRAADGRARRAESGSVLLNHVEGWAIVTETGKPSVNTIAEDAEDAIRRFLAGEMTDPDSTGGRKLRSTKKARNRASGNPSN
jgi:hypothetical protein